MKFAFVLVAAIVFQGFFGTNGDETIVIFNVTNTTQWQFETSNDTTTAVPITTTAPAPAEGHYRVNYTENHQYCVMMDVATLDLDITYPNKYGNHSTKMIHAPSTTTVAPSLCGENLTNHELFEELALRVPIREHSNRSFVLLTFFFTRHPNITGDKSLDKSQLYKIQARYSYFAEDFIDVDPKQIGRGVVAESNGTLKEFAVLHDRSYQCNSATAIKVDDKLTLKFTGLRVQAFVPNNHLDTPEPCPGDAQTSDLIPIVIGAVLAAIVLIVLIAYLIGRARMRRTTYESI